MNIKTAIVALFASTLLVAPGAAQTGTPIPAASKKVATEKVGKNATSGKGAAKAKKRAPTQFAVVDMTKAASHTLAYRRGLEQRKKMTERFQKELDGMTNRIKALKGEIEIMVDSPERMKNELERDTLIGKHNLAGKMFKAELERQRARNDDKIYQELSKSVGELAARRGILLVLRKHPHRTVAQMLAEKLARSTGEAMAQQIRANQQRSVIYHAPDLDLTEDLIKYLKAK